MLAQAARAQAQDSTPRRGAVRLIGVYDGTTGEPVAGVQVRDGFSGSYTMTSKTGLALLDFLTSRGDTAIIELRKLGFEARTLAVSRSDTTSLTEVLEHVTPLPAVVITGHYRIDRDPGLRNGFARRCQVKHITCFDSQELDERPAANFADLLKHVDGVAIGACTAVKGRDTQCGKVAMHSAQIPPAYCEPTIFVDGYQWNTTIGAAIDLTPGVPASAPFTPGNVKGVEVYPTSQPRPLRFEGDPLCGAIVIWTKGWDAGRAHRSVRSSAAALAAKRAGSSRRSGGSPLSWCSHHAGVGVPVAGHVASGPKSM